MNILKLKKTNIDLNIIKLTPIIHSFNLRSFKPPKIGRLNHNIVKF